MNVSDVATLVSTVGFPVVMCGVLFWYINKMTDTMVTAVKEMEIAINELKTVVEEHYHENN